MHYHDGTPAELGDTFTKAPGIGPDRYHSLRPGESAVCCEQFDGTTTCNLVGVKFRVMKAGMGSVGGSAMLLPGRLGAQLTAEVVTVTVTASECALVRRAGE